MIQVNSSSCCDCCYLGQMGRESACLNRRSLRYGPINEFRTACSLYASKAKAYREAPKKKRWFKVKSIYDLEIQGARL